MISYLIHLFIGFAMSYIGLLPPGMMNMTVVDRTISTGVRTAIKFALGASIIVGVQSMIALTFTQLFISNPSIIEGLKKTAILVFAGLCYFFYRKAKSTVAKGNTKSNRAPFISGILLSSLNMLAIPFYFGYCTIMEIKGWIVLEQPYINFIVLGASLGSFFLFLSYAVFANYIATKVSFVARNINYILSTLFALLTILAIVQSF